MVGGKNIDFCCVLAQDNSTECRIIMRNIRSLMYNPIIEHYPNSDKNCWHWYLCPELHTLDSAGVMPSKSSQPSLHYRIIRIKRITFKKLIESSSCSPKSSLSLSLIIPGWDNNKWSKHDNSVWAWSRTNPHWRLWDFEHHHCNVSPKHFRFQQILHCPCHRVDVFKLDLTFEIFCQLSIDHLHITLLLYTNIFTTQLV